MAANYYTLVAGLREYSLDAENKGFDALEIKEDIRSQLTKRDQECFDLFYSYYDIGNIANILAGRSQFLGLGNYDRETLEHEVKNPQELPDYIASVIAVFYDPENTDFDDADVDRNATIERALYDAYYKKASTAHCKFLRSWAEFDRNLRNLTAAFTARRLGFPVPEALVGDGYVVDMLGKSSAADFGLKGELDYIDTVISAIGDESNLLDKENRIDLIRWNMADELTAFNYFDINVILAYMVKVNIIDRWVRLDPARGREMFRRLLDSLGQGADPNENNEK